MPHPQSKHLFIVPAVNPQGKKHYLGGVIYNWYGISQKVLPKLPNAFA